MLTYSHYKKLGQELGLNKLNKVIISNFKDLEEILRYNKSNNIYFYRLTSKLIPLATHNEVLFDYISDYKDAFGNIGKIIKESKMRVDTHPDQYCVLNSIKDEVVKSSKEILLYHKEMFKAMGIDGKIIIHIGSGAYGKKKSIERFKENFYSLDEEIRKLIIIENDDKVFNAYDTLKLCKELGIPMVLDYHHYLCNKTSKKIEDLIEEIFNTWNNEKYPPKIHFSSSKGNNKKDVRAHHEYIDSKRFIEFINKIKFVNRDFDVMLEAKMKDMALFKLVAELKYREKYKWLNESTFEIKKGNLNNM